MNSFKNKKINTTTTKSFWNSLANTRSKFSNLFTNGTINSEWFENIEESLILADTGPLVAEEIKKELKEKIKKTSIKNDKNEAKEILFKIICDRLKLMQEENNVIEEITKINKNGFPAIIMVVGVNGSGKTTSIGKLAYKFKNQGLSVMLAAGDTFRAAAREQLIFWGKKNDITVISQVGGDPASVAFDAVKSAIAKNCNVLILDTAGRLPTQNHLMEELKKIKRVMSKALPSAPNHVWLILDSNTGQNALSQLKSFDSAINITGLILTKLDGSSKGGFVLSLKTSKQIPIIFIGLGEKISDLSTFEPFDLTNSFIGHIET